MNYLPLLAIAPAAGIALYAIEETIRNVINKRRRRGPKVVIVQGDITRQTVDVIVNAAKRSLLGGGGVDGAIHRAGGPAILEECKQIRDTRFPDGLPTGSAVCTTAGHLPADHVIHTVGPVYSTTLDRSAALRNCYINSLALADALDAETVAFPLISSGVYGWPVEDAIVQALAAIRTAPTRVKTVRLVLFDARTYRLAKLATR